MAADHIMFQTDCTENDSLPGGICAGGKVNAHAFSHLVSEDGARWRRVLDALRPTPGSPVDGFDGDCDGTVSFPEGIGPVILWGMHADSGTGHWPPKPDPPPGPPSPQPPSPPPPSPPPRRGARLKRIQDSVRKGGYRME